MTCTDPTAASDIATRIRDYSNGAVSCDGINWQMGSCGSGIEVHAGGTAICSCASTGPNDVVIRPCINPGNTNWGGGNSATCSSPTQTFTLEFNGGGGGGGDTTHRTPPHNPSHTCTLLSPLSHIHALSYSPLFQVNHIVAKMCAMGLWTRSMT